jgi:hypothetical protein
VVKIELCGEILYWHVSTFDVCTRPARHAGDCVPGARLGQRELLRDGVGIRTSAPGETTTDPRWKPAPDLDAMAIPGFTEQERQAMMKELGR